MKGGTQALAFLCLMHLIDYDMISDLENWEEIQHERKLIN